MRQFFLITMAVLSINLVEAQNKKVSYKPIPKIYEDSRADFLDTAFFEGTIIDKTYDPVKTYLNYNLLEEKLVYLSDDKIFAINNNSEFLQITYNDKCFIPISNSETAEVIKSFNNGVLLLLIRSLVPKNDFVGEMGTTTAETANSKDIAHLKDGGLYVNKSNKTDKIFALKEKYYIRIDGKIKSISTEKKLKKIFKSKADIVDVEINKKISNESNREKYIRIISACCE